MRRHLYWLLLYALVTLCLLAAAVEYKNPGFGILAFVAGFLAIDHYVKSEWWRNRITKAEIVTVGVVCGVLAIVFWGGLYKLIFK